MPTKPKTPCRHPQCPNLTDSRYCEQHKHLRDTRESATARGYDSRWRKARSRFLTIHPWCKHCAEHSRFERATVVDHIVPHRGDEKLLWDESNWQPLCKLCHDRKTGQHDRQPVYQYRDSR